MSELRERVAKAHVLLADGCECGAHPCPTWREEFAWLLETVEMQQIFGASLLKHAAAEVGHGRLLSILAAVQKEAQA